MNKNFKREPFIKHINYGEAGGSLNDLNIVLNPLKVKNEH
jgi:hypothetical protein